MVPEVRLPAVADIRVPAGPTGTFPVLQHDGPNHLGLRCNAFKEHQLAPITSGLCALSGAMQMCEAASIHPVVTMNNKGTVHAYIQIVSM